MSALIPAFTRPRGRVDPAVFGHVIRLVQHHYTISDSTVAPHRVSVRHSHNVVQPIPRCTKPNSYLASGSQGEGSTSNLRHYSAYAQAIQQEPDDPAPMYDTPTYFPVTAPTRPPSRRQDDTSPAWAHLPSALSTALSDGTVVSPAQFRTEFDRLECKSGQFASVDTLQQVFSLFLSAPEPSQWAWLSGQLGHMLAAVLDAGSFHPDVAALGQSMRAYCLAELGQEEEARGILFGGMALRRSTLAVDHSVRAIALTRIGEKEAATEQMIRAIRRGISPKGRGVYLTPTLADCFALYARHISDDDMLYILHHSGHRLRQLLTSMKDRERNQEFVSVWNGWLASAPVSLTLADTSPTGGFVRELHLSTLVRETTRAADAYTLFMEISNRGRTDHLHPAVVSRLIQSLRDHNYVDEAETVEQRTLSKAATRVRRNTSLLISAVTARDSEAAEDHLFNLADSPGLDSFALNEILELMSALDEPERAKRVFGLFDQIGIKPGLRAYTTMIGNHARRRELDEAASLFDSLINSGIEPDDVAISAIMNAHVEAGDWNGLAQRCSNVDEELLKSPDIVSVLMKAMVLKGSTTASVLDAFQGLDNPTNHHWSLILQSAADNGDFYMMKKLFGQMQARSWESGEAAKPDVYTFSILLHAYLRTNNLDQSREIYDEMLRQNIVPSSITYSMIISSYAKGSSRSGFQRAVDFAMSIHRLAGKGCQSPVDAGMRMPKGRTNENLLSPLVVAAGRANDPRLASQYFDLIAQDAEPSLPVFTRYLDVWRRAGETSMVMTIWAEIFALACRTISVTPSTPTRSSRPRRQPDNALVIPLTIVLITLGKEKRLLDIRRIWKEVRSAGFGFDATNFNHLAVSLAQSGDVEGAFDVVENVLATETVDTLDDARAVDSALSVDSASSFSASLHDGPPHSSDPAMAESTAFRPPTRRLEAVANNASAPPTTSIADRLSTFPNEKIWRPHFRTLVTLDSVVSQLESQQDRRAWLGLGSTEEAENEDELDTESSKASGTVVELPEFGTCVRDPVDGRPKQTNAKGLLMKLNRKYSKAMALVMFHRRKQSARRSATGSSRRGGYSST